ncbi:MAG: SAM-dependent methyltransferase, partial [Bacteroidia bacterium]|nr:SAM-dependent methyltransferase [Bacteroidia bacterium]
MKLAGEAGFLLKIEEEIKDVVAVAKAEYNKILRLHKEDDYFLPGMAPERAPTLFDFSDMSDQDFLDQAEDSILEALKKYAEQAENGHTVRRRLFAEDAARGFAFVDLCRKCYDVALMNPPFGEVSDHLSDYLARKYPTWNKNILCAFIEQGYWMSRTKGAAAAIYDRTAIVKSTYEDFRRTTLVADNRLSAMADLGWGVLDANVEVTASIFNHKPATETGVFIDCREINVDDKESRLEDSIRNLVVGVIRNGTVCASGASFQHLPNAVVGYDFPRFLMSAFRAFPSLEKSGFKANQGFALKAEKHFRAWWEVPSNSRMVINRMFNGAGYRPFVTILYDVAISSVEPEDLPMDSSTRKSGIGSHRKMGICFGKRGDFFCTHVLPKGQIFTVEGQSIPIECPEKAREVIAFLSTPLVRYSLNKYCGQHKYSGYVNLFPYHQLSNIEECRERVEHVIDEIRDAQRLDETQSFFSILRLGKNVNDRATLINSLIISVFDLSLETERFCHEESIYTYKLSKQERADVEAFRNRQPRIESPISDVDISSSCRWFTAHSEISMTIGIIFGRWDVRIALDPLLVPKLPDPFDPLPICPPGMLIAQDGLPAESGSIVSEEWLKARPDANTLSLEGAVKNSTIPDSEYPLRISWNGILVDDPGFNGIQPHREDIVRRAREVLDLLWKDKAYEIEQEACDILGVSELRDYFRKPTGFFQDHLKRYSKSRRKAPIYWPLSTKSGTYTIWIYYHRLTDQTLFAAVNNYVDPKITEVDRDLSRIEKELKGTAGGEATRLRDQMNDSQTFLGELRELRDELLRIAELPYKPNLND